LTSEARRTSRPAATKSQKQQNAQAEQEASLPLTPALLKRLYHSMLKCRLVEERTSLLLHQNKFTGDYCPAMLQEAVAVGATTNMLHDDCLAPLSLNSIAHVLRGAPLKSFFEQLFVKNSNGTEGTWQSRSGFHVIPPATNPEAQLNLGAGVALAYKMHNKRGVVVALAAGGLGCKKPAQDAFTFAGVHKLPIVYVIGSASVAPLAASAAGKFPLITVDGDDVVAVYRVCHEVRERARQGYGPTLVECRRAGLPHEQIRRDPLVLMESYLQRHNLWNDSWKERITEEISSEIEQAVVFARNLI
jgi:TPP-dependent pyruvate/acetoin dehydrogenase alpha subunit